ncbi:MAG: hypothetical protein E7523_03905 [Ruminococcaceae bacterium]|nr:hypothetical protein [Oscillospiraceae bacterium]
MKNHKVKDILAAMYKNNKKQMYILLGAIFVLLLLCSGDLFATSSEKTKDTTKEVYALEKELECKLEDFLETVDGVGKTKVCIMFDLLEETSYAANTDTDSDESSLEYVVVENADGSEGGLPIRIRAPQIRGVAVTCEGGASAKVRNEVTSLLTASLGITANRVYVSQYSEKKINS